MNVSDTYAVADSKIQLAQDESQLSSQEGAAADSDDDDQSHLSRTRGKRYDYSID